MRRATLVALTVATLGVAPAAGCKGTTGDELVTFTPYAAGAAEASQPFSAGGFRIQLTTARMRIGALYFDESPPSTSTCIAPGVYAAQVSGPVEVDLLSGQPQEFSVYGNGSADTALSWQLWLTDGDINEANQAHMVDLAGTATCDGTVCPAGTQFSFGAIVTINQNRVPSVSDPSQPGLYPICKERIIQLGGIDLPFSPNGTLRVTIDPRQWFNLGIDFSTLPLVTGEECLTGDSEVAMTPADYALAPYVTPSGSCGGSGQPCCSSGGDAGPSASSCSPPLSCTSSDPSVGLCAPTYCIPDTSFGTGAGAQQGVELFEGVFTGGSSAYSVSYSP